MRERGVHTTSFVAGLLFILLGGMFLLDALEVWSVRPVVVLPVLLIGLGVAIIASAAFRGNQL